MEVDIRQGNASIDAIRFSDGLKLTGGPNLPNIKVENQAGNATIICAKAEIPALIRALQLAAKTWE